MGLVTAIARGTYAAELADNPHMSLADRTRWEELIKLHETTDEAGRILSLEELAKIAEVCKRNVQQRKLPVDGVGE